MTDTVTVKQIFLDPSRCIGCRSCVAACRECDTHKGESMIYIDYIERDQSVATSPTLCMHCEDPLAPCAQVCPAQAIMVSPDGVVHQADEARCIYCENCGYACPFGVPKFDINKHFMRKCNLCYDRTSQGKGPMCTTVCPTQALFYGTYEEWVAAGRGKQGAKPVNIFFFGRQQVRTRNYVVLTEQDDTLDLMALLDQKTLGKGSNIPAPTAARNAEQWVEAKTAGIPECAAPAQPWAARNPQPFTLPPLPSNPWEHGAQPEEGGA
jgi:Fe-S-cluster-containing dehydrogenase component